jgi:uncharacterized protein
MSTVRGDFPAATIRRFSRTRWPLRVALGVLVAFLVVSNLVTAWTEYLWFHEDVAQADTWSRIWSAKLTLLFGGSAFVFAIVSLALLTAERVAPADAVFSRTDPLLALRAFSARRQNFSRNAVAAVSALAFGPAAMTMWEKWTLFRFGPTDATNEGGMFGRGVNFYMFRLPFLRELSGWLFAVTLVTLVLTAFALLLNGAIRNTDNRVLVTQPARALLSGMLGLVFLTRAFGFWFSRYALALSSHQRFDGVGYVDGKVKSPAYVLMALASLVCALLMLFNVYKKRWDLIVAAVGAWLLVAPISLFVVPAVWQRVAVSNELERERPALTRHIAATRKAFELDDVQNVDLKLTDAAAAGNAEDLVAGSASIRNARLWDVSQLRDVGGLTRVARDAVNSSQKSNPNYVIDDVDVVPRVLDGKLVPTLSGVRELVPDTQGSWVKETLQWTHGFGVAMAAGNTASNGDPVFSLKSLPPIGTPKLAEPRIYFGERTSKYVVVNAKSPATDIVGPTGKSAPKYVGRGGVGLSSGLRRLAFAWKYRDLDLAISKSVTSSSRLLTSRSVTSRVRAVAPFLHLDSDPYAVVQNGQILWIVEAYVASSSYPNSDRSSRYAINGSKSSASEPYSYIRNSIRVVVNAYSGKVQLFRTQVDEPIAQTYAKAYPLLFETSTIDALYPEITSKLRYPSDLFNLRANLWGRFHVGNADKFYDESDRWSIGASDARVLRESVVGQSVAADELSPPEYIVGDPLLTGQQAFFIQQALVAKGRNAESAADQRLRSLILAQANPKNHGRLVSLTVPVAFPYDSPSSVGKRFSSDSKIASEETFLGQRGSVVVNGQVQIVRLKSSLLYIRPMYVRGDGANASRPQLNNVEVRFGNKIGFAPTLAGALAQVGGVEPNTATGAASPIGTTGAAGTPGLAGTSGPLGANPATTTPGSASSTATPLPENPTVPQILARAEALVSDADDALKKGDLGRYKAINDEIASLIRRAQTVTKLPAK